jgi:hypothetical protein
MSSSSTLALMSSRTGILTTRVVRSESLTLSHERWGVSLRFAVLASLIQHVVLWRGPHHVAFLHKVAWDVNPATVDLDVPVTNHLAGLCPRHAQSGRLHDVVQPSLQQGQQVLTRIACLSAGFLEVSSELPLGYAVEALAFLLFP